MKDYTARLRDFWFPDLNAFWWLLLALPALYFFQTTIHEGSHTMAAFVVTGNLPKLAPFPHRARGDGFLNGVTIPQPNGSTSVTVLERTSCTSQALQSNKRLAGFSATPQFVDLVLIAIFTVIFVSTKSSNPKVRFLVRLWYLAACLDFCYNTIRGLIGGCLYGRDWSIFMVGSDIDPASFSLLTMVLWIVFIASHFMWVNRSGWSDPVRSTEFWDYRWIAFLLGCLSLLAVLLSIFISAPQIIKKSPEFIVLFTIQIGALLWYWIYFGLTFKKDKPLLIA